MTVDAVAFVGGDEIARSWALNEVSVEKQSRERILEVVLEVDCRPVSAFGCDGVLCSTPTGSTAACSPRRAHWRAAAGAGAAARTQQRTCVVRPADGHRAQQSGGDRDPAEQSPAVLDCDGRRTAALPSGARVEVTAGATPVRMVRLDGRPFTDRLVRKFDLPIRGWRAPRDARTPP